MKPFDLEKALAGEQIVNTQNGKRYWVIGESRFDNVSYITEDENGVVDVEKIDALNQHCRMWEEPRPRVQLDLPTPLKRAKEDQLVFKKGSRCIINFYFDPNNKKHCDMLEAGSLFESEENAQEWLDAMKGSRR
ncbi:hypothetical protein ACT2CV_01190 [Pasteurellaceae bacterium 22721_9_1]